jgi:long-chain fatty acid transport protein
MTIKLFGKPLLSLAMAGILVYSHPTQAGGFQITEVCAQCQGVRNAGMGASSIDGAAALYFNPASMTRSSGGDVDVSVHYIDSNFNFQNRGSTNAVGRPAVGITTDNAGKGATVPTFFYAQQINNQWAAGIGVNVPYGLSTNYNSDWVGRYNAVESKLETVNINPAVAFRFNEQFSIGLGFNAMWANAKLSNALDFGTLAYGLGVPGARPSTPAFDGFQKLTGDDWGYGWNAGVLFELSPDTRFGVAYRSKINTNLNGNVDITGNALLAQLPAPLGPAFSSRTLPVSAALTLPATLILGASHELTDRWSIMAGATWTQWSDFNELRVKFKGTTLPDSVQPENWNDAWRFSVGTRYKLSDHWTLRGGFEYDATPVSGQYITPRIPDADRYWFALGVGYQISQAFSFDLAYTYLFTRNYSIDDHEVTTGQRAGNPLLGSTLRGTYEADASIFSAQLSWRF